MFSTLPVWLRGPILSWIESGKTSAKAIQERSEWEMNFEQVYQSNKAVLKDIGRSGIPSDLRHSIWTRLLHINEIPEHLKDYQGCLLEFFGTTSPEHFPDPSFSHSLDIARLHLSSERVDQIKGILYIIGNSFPVLEFTPMIPTLVSVFSVYLEPDDVLGCMASVIMAHSKAALNRNDWAYFPMNRRDYLVFQRVFKLLIEIYEPSIYKKIADIQMESVNFEPDWDYLLAEMLVEIYPKKVVMRIMDCYLIEGFKIIFRFALAHLHLRKKQILLSKGPDELNDALFKPEHGHSKDIKAAFFRHAFNYSLSRSKIKRLRNKVMKSDLEDFDSVDHNLILHKPVPKLMTPSAFVKLSHWASLWSWIPSRYRFLDLQRIFSTDLNGFSLKSLYRCSDINEPLVLVIETDDEIIGAYVSKSFSSRGNYYFGTGETFVFRLTPDPHAYQWQPKTKSTALIFAEDDFLAFGGGGSGFGLSIDDQLETVCSKECLTFGNPPLIPSGKARILNVEVYSFI